MRAADSQKIELVSLDTVCHQVVDEKGNVLSRCLVCDYDDDGGVNLFQLYTLPAFRGMGYARRLMREVIMAYPASRIVLEPSPFLDKPVSVSELVKFYQSLGFRQRGAQTMEICAFTYQQILSHLSGFRPVRQELKLQDQVESDLRKKEISFHREFSCQGGIVDFLIYIGGRRYALELKTGGSFREAVRQVKRYLDSDEFAGGFILTTKPWTSSQTVNHRGKKIRIISTWKGGL